MDIFISVIKCLLDRNKVKHANLICAPNKTTRERERERESEREREKAGERESFANQTVTVFRITY